MVLGIDGVVYLMSKPVNRYTNAWMVGVDLRKKRVTGVVPVSSLRLACSFEREDMSRPDFLTCDFSEYLNATPR
jgi:hypothetical protein